MLTTGSFDSLKEVAQALSSNRTLEENQALPIIPSEFPEIGFYSINYSQCALKGCNALNSSLIRNMNYFFTIHQKNLLNKMQHHVR